MDRHVLGRSLALHHHGQGLRLFAQSLHDVLAVIDNVLIVGARNARQRGGGEQSNPNRDVAQTSNFELKFWTW